MIKYTQQSLNQYRYCIFSSIGGYLKNVDLNIAYWLLDIGKIEGWIRRGLYEHIEMSQSWFIQLIHFKNNYKLKI